MHNIVIILLDCIRLSFHIVTRIHIYLDYVLYFSAIINNIAMNEKMLYCVCFFFSPLGYKLKMELLDSWLF